MSGGVGKMHEPLETIIEGIFTLKGYDIVRSSAENRLIMAIKNDIKLAIGYSDLETSSTPGEIEMFQSMSESEGARERIFISPAKMVRETLLMLKDKGIEVWDRTALVLAIGETALKNAALHDSLEEWDPVDEDTTERIASAETDDIDPIAELRRFQREIESQASEFNIKKVDVDRSRSSDRERPEKPSPAEVRIRKAEFPMDLPVIDDVNKPGKEGADETPQAVPDPQDAAEKDAGDDRSINRMELPVAPLRVSEETAREMAPGKISDLRLIHRPFLFLSVEYDLKEIDGPSMDRRSGSVMIDLVDGSVMDMPPSIIEDLDPPKEGDPLKAEDHAIDEEKAIDRCILWIGANDHRLERKLHDGMMSTIYGELEAAMDAGSVKVVFSKRIILPLWKGSLVIDGSPWLIDGYAGIQRRGR